jgi:hypothetical protein
MVRNQVVEPLWNHSQLLPENTNIWVWLRWTMLLSMPSGLCHNASEVTDFTHNPDSPNKILKHQG